MSRVDFTFAIIGGGLTSTAMLLHLVNRVRRKAEDKQLNPSRIGIQVFEKQDVFGPGFPHNERFVLPFHITNMCASDMGILDGKPDDFQDWVTSNLDPLRHRFSWFQGSPLQLETEWDRCNHYPRAIMGEYLKTRFQESVKKAREVGLEVNLYPKSEVVGLKESEHGVRLTIEDLYSKRHFSCDVDRVLLATGHWSKKNDEDHYFTSPWPAKKLLRGIPKGEKIAVIGTSLSAIETVLTLTSEGKFFRTPTDELGYAPPEHSRTLVLYSRRGLLPKVRGRIGDRRNTFLNRENLMRLLAQNRGNLKLDEIFQLLDSELEVAYRHKIDWEAIVNPRGEPEERLQGYLDDAVNGDGKRGELIWQTVLHRSLDIVREVYLNLRLEDRRRFDRHYGSMFFTHAAPQPAINAEKLLALMKAKIVDVIKLGANYRMVRSDDGSCYSFIYRDIHGNQKTDAYRYVVDARGQLTSLETNPSKLAKNLLQSGTVHIEEIRTIDPEVSPGEEDAPKLETPVYAYKTGSICIDPKTHHIMQMGPDKKFRRSSTIYAVGAMTRGQIIDASMAHGIAQSTSKIADDLVEYLIRVQNP